MAIQSGLSTGVQNLNASGSDKSVHSVANRTAVTGFSIQNNYTADVALSIYESPNATSASGKRVASLIVAAGKAADVLECIGQGYAGGTQLIVLVTTLGIPTNVLVAKLTYTLFTADS